ncbi:unnamed protein product, partial [Prorocentrum cordatum]
PSWLRVGCKNHRFWEVSRQTWRQQLTEPHGDHRLHMPASEGFPTLSLRQKHVKQLAKTEICKFFLSSRCVKGAQCPYAHSPSEIREKPDLGKTSMCRDFLTTGNCTNPGCRFAHSERELRSTSGFFRTKVCSFAGSGRCKYGAACRFAHSPGEIPPAPGAEGPPPPPPRASEAQRAALGPAAARGGGRGLRPGGGAKAGDFDPGAGRDAGSDQSTRDATSASASTPSGSGDSAQDGGAARGLRRRRGPAAAPRQCTTLIIRNIPDFLTQGAVTSLLEDLTECMRGAFDFFFCPWNSSQGRNLGFAIVNFFSRSAAADFESRWANEPLLPGIHGAKKMRLLPSALQGRAANLRHFSGFSLAHHPDPRFRPLVRASPDEELRPMALPEEIMQGPLAGPEQGDREELEEQGDFFEALQDLCHDPERDLPGPWADGAGLPPARAAVSGGLVDRRPGFAAPPAASSVGHPEGEPYQGLHRCGGPQPPGLQRPLEAPAAPVLPMPTQLGLGAGQGLLGCWAREAMASRSGSGDARAYSRAATAGTRPAAAQAFSDCPPPARFDPRGRCPLTVPEAAEDTDEVHSSSWSAEHR